jgi:hypothetical protein
MGITQFVLFTYETGAERSQSSAGADLKKQNLMPKTQWHISVIQCNCSFTQKELESLYYRQN